MVIVALKGGQYKVLTDDQIKNIHQTSLDVLAEVGVRIEYRPALELMADCGCNVDFDKRIVKIPEYILKKALQSAPSRFTLYGREPGFDVHVNTRNVCTIGGSSALFILGLDGKRRSATLQDLVDLTRLQDNLENLLILCMELSMLRIYLSQVFAGVFLLQ